MLKRSGILAAAFALSALGGCAASVKKETAVAPLQLAADSSHAIVLNLDGSKVATEAKDWAEFKGEWQRAMREASSAAHVTYVESGAAQKAGTQVSIYVKDYRYISTGARYGLGIMTGNAFVEADARFSDLKSGQSLGERHYNTSSSAWQGVFSAMTAKQIDAICKEIVAEITGSAGASRPQG